ncbi:MAG: hypothetical protein ACXVCP_08415 [Bdellovibrio sp.]
MNSIFKNLLLFTIPFAFLFSLNYAQASTLLTSSCTVIPYSEMQTHRFSWRDTSIGLSCETLKSSKETFDLISTSLLPVSVALNVSPEIHNAFMAELSSIGLTIANPAVLAATVVGTVGVATFYIILNKSFEECAEFEKNDLKESIIKEISQKYNLKPSLRTSFEIYKN